MTPDLVVRGRVWHRGSLTEGAVGIRDGRIQEVRRSLSGDSVLDFGSALILPAAVDIHVHLRDPGMTHKEDFYTGTLAAAYGGVSCVAEMPNTIPLTFDAEGLREKLYSAEKANVDCALYGLLSPGADLDAMGERIMGLKLFAYEHTPGTWHALLERCGKRFVAVHAEHPDHLKKLEVRSPADHLRARPDSAEVEAVQALLALRKRLHICHVSAASTIPLLTEGSAEVTPHHLFLNCKANLGALGKVNPPLRRNEDREALWDALRSGKIQVVASDHAPHTLEEKEDFASAPPGVPGVETMYPIMLRAVRDGRLELDRCMDVCCERPAALLGLRKGKIEPGYDADIIAIDPRLSKRIRGEELHSKCGWTPFEGWEAPFPIMTMVRGTPVVLKGALEAEKTGKVLTPADDGRSPHQGKRYITY